MLIIAMTGGKRPTNGRQGGHDLWEKASPVLRVPGLFSKKYYGLILVESSQKRETGTAEVTYEQFLP
jgi:hypothetical protein